MAVNLIFGGKTDPISLSELSEIGINMVIYSTPCLFAAHSAVDKMLASLSDNNGLLDSRLNSVTLNENDQFLRSKS